MSLKILTLNWNGADKLEKLYPSLVKSLKNIDYQWYIKDNGSSDNSLNMIKSWDNSNIIGIDYKHNKDNYSEGCNFLFKEATPNDNDLVLLLNNDVVFNDISSIGKMISIMEKDQEVGVVGAKLLYTGTNTLQHAGVVFSHKTYNLPTHFRAKQVDDENSSKRREFQAITGAVLLTQAKYYKNISNDNKSMPGLPHDMIWSFEDIWACLSIKYEQNKKIVYCGDTNIFHQESATLAKNPLNKLFLQHNMNGFLKKWGKITKFDKETYIANKDYNLYRK